VILRKRRRSGSGVPEPTDSEVCDRVDTYFRQVPSEALPQTAKPCRGWPGPPAQYGSLNHRDHRDHNDRKTAADHEKPLILNNSEES
jgi:hypothetical protein